MNKAQFQELLDYLRNRPSEAARLQRVLFNGEEDLSHCFHQDTEVSDFVTASVAGSLIGKSGKWVKEHRFLFPSAVFGKSRWYFDRRDVVTQYNNYVTQMRWEMERIG